MDKDLVTSLTADIVAAYVANNKVAIGDVVTLVEQIYRALVKLGEPLGPSTQARIPAISIPASIKPDHVVCLECGKRQKTLKRHLQVAHGLTPENYRRAYSLLPDYPMVAPDYALRRRELAYSLGLGRTNRDAKRPAKRVGKLKANAKIPAG